MNMNFNRYRLNANYTTEDGINLIDPEFRIKKVLYCDDMGQSELLLNWKDSNNDIDRSFETPISDLNFPTVAFLEGQLLQIPIFSNASLIPAE